MSQVQPEASAVQLQVSKEIVEKIVQAQIGVEVAKVLGDKQGLLEALIAQTLSLKVDSQGAVNRYSSYNTTTYLQYLVGNVIRGAAKSAVEKYVSANAEKIEKAVATEMKKSTAPMVKAFMDCITESAKSAYRLTINVESTKNN